MLAPRIIGIACIKVISPAFTKPTTKTVVAELLCIKAVIIIPRVNDLKEFLKIYLLKSNSSFPVVAFCIVFTKSDKLNKSTLPKNIENYKKELLETWEELPPYFISSATNKAGQKEILDFIQNVNESINKNEPIS